MDKKRAFTTPNKDLYSSDYTQYLRSKTKYSTSANLAKTMVENGGSLPKTDNDLIKTYKGPYTFSSTDLSNPNGVYCINQSRSYEDLLDITKGKYLSTPQILNSTYITKDKLQVSQLYNSVFFDFDYEGPALQLTLPSPGVPENTIVYDITTDNDQLIYVDNTYSLFYNSKDDCYRSLFNFDYITLNNRTVDAVLAMRRIQIQNLLNGFTYPCKFTLDTCLNPVNNVDYDIFIPIIITSVSNLNTPSINSLHITWYPPVLNGQVLYDGAYRILYSGPTSGEVITTNTEYYLPISFVPNVQYSIYVQKKDPTITFEGGQYFTSLELVAPLIISTVVGVVGVGSTTNVTIGWLPPTLGGQLLTPGGYNIYKDNIVIATVSSATTSYTIPGLGPSAQSSIYVVGLDSGGNEIFESQTLVAPLVLTTPVINYINGINITWLPPTLDGVSLVTSGYDISYNSVSGTSITPQITGEIPVSASTTTYTIPLNYGLLYNIYVTGGTFVSQTIQDTIIIPEVIVYNNPQKFPKSASVDGEVGLVIGIPSSGVNPLTGFSQYTSVTITNIDSGGSDSITLAGNLDKYLVYGEPGTASSFIATLTPSTASNIALVETNNIASGAAFGKVIRFEFSGGTSPSPALYTCYYDPGPIDATQGSIVSMYYTISATLPTIPPVPGAFSLKGRFYTQWKGYSSGSYSNPNTIQQAWGISADSASPTYAPLIQSGITPNQAFYVETNIGSPYYYYNGIPKMITPNYS